MPLVITKTIAHPWRVPMVKQLAVIDMKECGVTEKLLVLQEVTLIPHMLIDKLEFENDD